MIPAAKGKNASYEARQKRAHDWPLVLASVNLTMDGDKVCRPRGSSSTAWRRFPGEASAAEKAITGKPCDDRDRRGRRRGRGRGRHAPVDERLQGQADQDRGQAGSAWPRQVNATGSI